MEDIYYIVVFNSRNRGMQLYQYLKSRGYNQFQLIATPCKVKAGCGYAIKFNNLGDYYILNEVGKKINIHVLNLYEAKRKDRRRVLKKIDNI